MKFVRSSVRLGSLILFLSSLWITAAQGAVLVSIGQNFDGTSYGTYTTNSGALPPDSNGAVGPNYFVEFVNGIFAVYAKTNGEQVDIKTDLDFWAAAGVGLSMEYEVTDPRVIYDPQSQRWFASMVDADVFAQILDNVLSSNQFLLAVSATSDPTGRWKGIAFDSDPQNGNFADFPTLGVDSQGVYLAGDMFPADGDPMTATDIGCALTSFPKSELLKTTPNFASRTFFGTMDFSARGQIYQPATCLDGSVAGRILAAGDIGNDSNPHSNLVTFAVQNVAGPGTPTLAPSTFLNVTPYMVPYNAAMATPLFTARQPDGTSTLMANDARFCAKTYVVGGVLFGVHNTELNGRIAIRWYRINAATGALLESGTIADTNLDLFFPCIAANQAGTVVIGYNSSGLGTNYVSCCAMVGQTINGVTTFGSPVILQAGAVSYHGDDEDPTGQLGNPVSRWGDYNSISVDPVDPSRFWTIEIYPTDVNVWTTRITEIITTPLSLTITRAAPNIILSWPTALATYQLQSATNLAAPINWSNITQTPVTNGNQLTLTLPISVGARFFRVQHP